MITDEDDSGLARSVSNTLEQSIEHLDAATLSRLNRARHNALAVEQRRGAGLPWLTAGALAAIAVAVLASLMLTSPDTLTSDMPIASIEDAEFIVASEDIEMLEDLDFVSWMVAQDNAG